MAKREVWIAGATQGIGACLADALADGFDVVKLSRRVGHDLTRPGALRDLLAERGAPWGWLHCPGDFFEKPLLATSDDDWEALFESNLRMFLRTARDVVEAMVQAGRGRVVAFGVAGLSVANGKTRGPAYFAVKSALLSVVRSLALEVAASGVTVNMISPGAIVHEHSHEESQRRVAPKIPLGRLGEPRDLVGAAKLLLSDGGAYLTGQEIVVDGGLSLGRPTI